MTTKNQPATGWRDAIAAELSNLTDPLKISTITAIIQSRITGQGYDTPAFWGRLDTCSRSTFNKWKRYDPAFTAALDAAWTIIQQQQSEAAADAVAAAVSRLQLATPQAVNRIIEIVNSPDEPVALRAATAVLDRAHTYTSTKTPAAAVTLPPSVAAMLNKVYGDAESDAVNAAASGDLQPDAE